MSLYVRVVFLRLAYYRHALPILMYVRVVFLQWHNRHALLVKLYVRALPLQ